MNQTRSGGNDIDQMIKRQEDKLRSQYGLAPKASSFDKYSQTAIPNNQNKESVENVKLDRLFKETSWGGGELVKNIKTIITKNLGYTLGDAKINSFIQLAKSRNHFSFLSKNNIEDESALANFLATSLVFHMLIEELKSQDFAILEMLAKKASHSTKKLQLALQIKIMSTAKVSPPFKDDRKYSTKNSLNSISDETLQKTVLSIVQAEANLWAKDPSIFLDELADHLLISEIINPLPVLKNKNDLESAFLILDLDPESSLDEIKKAYKKKALFFHPDKIGQMKLSPYLLEVANKKFNTIKEAYDMLISKRA